MELLLSLLGLAFFVALGLALIGVPILFRRVNRLTREVAELRARDLPIPAQTQAETSEYVAARPTEVAEETKVSETPVSALADPEKSMDTIEGTIAEEARSPQSSETAGWASKAQKSSASKARRATWPEPLQALAEKLLAMNLTAQVGAVVLIFGAIFLGKYASDIGLLTFTAKLVLMGAVSAALVIVGIRFQTRLKVYADVLQATGFAGWLVTLFVGHVLYELLPWWVAFSGGLAAVVLIGYRALRQNSQALAMVAFLGGFVTPFIASSDVGSLWRLFGYLALLNAAVVWIGWHRPWRWLVREATVGTFGLVAALMLAEYLQDDLLLSDIQWPFASFLLLSLIEFSILAAGWLRKHQIAVDRHASGLLFGVPAATVLALQALLSNQPLWLAVSLLGIGAWYALLALRFRSVFWVPAVVFGSMAVPYALNDGLTTLTYSLEGLGFVYWASRHQHRLPLIWGLILQLAAAVFAFRLFLDPIMQAEQLWLSWVLNGAVVAAAWVSAWWLNRSPVFQSRLQAILDNGLMGWALLIWFYQWGFWLAETQTQQLTLFGLLSVSVLTVGLTSVAAWRLSWTVMWTAMRLSSLLALLSGLVFLLEYGNRASWSLLTMVGVLSGFLLVYRIRISALWVPAAAWDGFLLWFGLIALTAGSVYAAPTFMTDWNLALGVTAVLVPSLFLQRSLRRLIPPAPYRSFARLLTLLLLAILACVSMTRLGNYAPLAYWPLLHPVLLVGLLGLEILFRFLRRRRVLRLVWVVLLGMTLTMELNRWLFHYAGVAFDLEAWLRSPLTQMVWSLTWTLLGGVLMISGARRRLSRSRWALGASILAVIVLKLFALDLAAVDTLYRILSFLGVGALLLAIGYIAPMPKRATSGEH